MATTTLAPPKSFRGISPRELLSAEATDGGPPVTVFGQTTRFITLKAGAPVKVDAPTAAAFRPWEANTDVVTVAIAGYKKVRFQTTILASTVPEGTRIALRGLIALLTPWQFLDGDEGPWLPVHEVATTDGVIIPIFSGWFVIADDFDLDNLTLEWVVYGGDATGAFVCGDIFIELTADPRPPTNTVPEPPDIPTTNPTLVAEWDPTLAEQTAGTITDTAP